MLKVSLNWEDSDKCEATQYLKVPIKMYLGTLKVNIPNARRLKN